MESKNAEHWTVKGRWSGVREGNLERRTENTEWLFQVWLKWGHQGKPLGGAHHGHWLLFFVHWDSPLTLIFQKTQSLNVLIIHNSRQHEKLKTRTLVKTMSPPKLSSMEHACSASYKWVLLKTKWIPLLNKYGNCLIKQSWIVFLTSQDILQGNVVLLTSGRAAQGGCIFSISNKPSIFWQIPVLISCKVLCECIFELSPLSHPSQRIAVPKHFLCGILEQLVVHNVLTLFEYGTSFVKRHLLICQQTKY